VLTTVKFNDKFGGVAHKIRHVIFDGDLPAEPGSAQSVAT
jgi:hypothetical protein